jgi:mRNA interferase MazF
MARYIPAKGDFITLSFDPQSGHEQRGRRPGLVVSNHLFNKHTGLALVCPLTNTDRKIPFHLPVSDTGKVGGFVMVDQVKSVDYVARKASFIARAPAELVEDVLAVLEAMTKQAT